MRTPDDIVVFYREVLEDGRDFLGFIGDVVLNYLPREKLLLFAETVKIPERYEENPLTEEYIFQEMKKYMEFAWTKVQDHRGISATRSVQKMIAWLWLLGDEGLCAFAQQDDHYPMYGAPVLLEICQKYDIPVPSDERVFRMAKGLPCHDECHEGCR